MNTNLIKSATNNVNPNLAYIGDKLDTAISAISTKLGVGINHFWPLLVKQQFIEGITSLISIIVFLLVATSCFYVAFSRRAIHEKKYNGDCMFIMSLISGIILSIILISVLAFGNGIIINQVFNPEAIALQEIIQQIK